MWSMKETNFLRQKLKNKYSQYSWYYGSYVVPDFEGYAIVIEATKIDNEVKKIVSTYVKNTNIRLQLKNKQYLDDNIGLALL